MRGRHGYYVAGTARTDDRGEFRMHGLPPGAYLIGAVYERATSTPGEIDQHPLDAEGRELPVLAYTTTFYPNTVRLNEAVPVNVDYGSETAGIDIALRLVRKVNLRGRVTDGITGEVVASAAITLQRMDARNNGTLPGPVQAVFDRRTSEFQVRDITPGAYLMTAEGSAGDKRMIGRVLLNITEQDVDNIELVIAPERAWSGVLRVEGVSNWKEAGGIIAALEPRSEKVSAVNVDAGSGKFHCQVLGDETYDVYLRNLPDDYHLAEVRVNGTNVITYGLDGSFASIDKPFELVLDSRGGRVAGVISGTDGNVWSGANLALIPDPAQGHLQDYRESSADESGRFRIRGVAPGKYFLIGWLDDPPCDYYNADALDACRAAGRSVTVLQAGEENVTLMMRP